MDSNSSTLYVRIFHKNVVFSTYTYNIDEIDTCSQYRQHSRADSVFERVYNCVAFLYLLYF